MEDIAAVAPVVGDVGVGDAGRGRDEVGPAREGLGDGAVEDGEGDGPGLVGQRVLGSAELIGEAPALRIHEDGAVLVEAGLDAERGRDEAHQQRAQQAVGQSLGREFGGEADDAPRRQPPHQAGAAGGTKRSLGPCTMSPLTMRAPSANASL